ncbi:hypothetical protein [Bradyrhizobium sp. ERR14]|nr:hypothetical protein [Bradyrhizobium sp. ERR14]MBB4392171.1 hypothetical protein [Bradyrhizobium sp. ERR14]
MESQLGDYATFLAFMDACCCQRMEFHADAKTGAITSEKLDD